MAKLRLLLTSILKLTTCIIISCAKWSVLIILRGVHKYEYIVNIVCG
jgi:hypothetical protein